MFLHRHGAALKKNIPNLARIVSSEILVKENKTMSTTNGVKDEKNSVKVNTRNLHAIKFSETVDIEAVMMTPFAQDKTYNANGTKGDREAKFRTVYAKPTSIFLKDIYESYGWSQIVTFIVGGFPITPAGKS